MNEYEKHNALRSAVRQLIGLTGEQHEMLAKIMDEPRSYAEGLYEDIKREKKELLEQLRRDAEPPPDYEILQFIRLFVGTFGFYTDTLGEFLRDPEEVNSNKWRREHFDKMLAMFIDRGFTAAKLQPLIDELKQAEEAPKKEGAQPE